MSLPEAARSLWPAVIDRPPARRCVDRVLDQSDTGDPLCGQYPLAERDIDNIAADAGRYLNKVYGRHPSRKLRPIHDVLLGRFTDRYLWRRQMRRWLLIIASCQCGEAGDSHRYEFGYPF
jgi:hypothetical protein